MEYALLATRCIQTLYMYHQVLMSQYFSFTSTRHHDHRLLNESVYESDIVRYRV